MIHSLFKSQSSAYLSSQGDLVGHGIKLRIQSTMTSTSRAHGFIQSTLTLSSVRDLVQPQLATDSTIVSEMNFM